MRRADRGPVALLMATSALLGAAFYFASPAKADDVLDDAETTYVTRYGAGAICPVIRRHASPAGVMGVISGIVNHTGWDEGSAVDVINASVWLYCPDQWPLLVAIGKAARGEAAVPA